MRWYIVRDDKTSPVTFTYEIAFNMAADDDVFDSD